MEYDILFAFYQPTTSLLIKVIRMSNSITMSKKYWSQQETEVLVDQFILRKVSVDY